MSFYDCLNCEQENKVCKNMLLTMGEFIKRIDILNDLQSVTLKKLSLFRISRGGYDYSREN